jgi:peptidoglycan hydrolase CwlO-like protein
MRDSVTMEIGDQPVVSDPAAGDTVSPSAERSVSEGAVVGSAGRRGRRWLWAILSILFVLGIAVSTIMERSERNGALDTAVEGARNEAQLAIATLTHKQLTKPLTGSSYDRLAAKLWRSVSSGGTVAGVTIWSSHGRILFSLNESLVGTTPPEMRSLIMGIAEGSGSARVLDETVQTFTPISKKTRGPVIVEIDQPISVVEAQVGNVWSMLRLGFGVGLAVALLFLVLSFVRPNRTVRAREHEERPESDERHEGDVGAETNAEGRPTYEEVFGLQHEHELDQTVEQEADLEGDPEALEGDAEALDGDAEDLEGDAEDLEGDPEQLDGDPEALKSIRQWDEKYEGMVQEELQTQELMRQRREEFKARAEAAALRVKKLEAEPDEAPPTTD